MVEPPGRMMGVVNDAVELDCVEADPVDEPETVWVVDEPAAVVDEPAADCVVDEPAAVVDEPATVCVVDESAAVVDPVDVSAAEVEASVVVDPPGRMMGLVKSLDDVAEADSVEAEAEVVV